MSDKNAARRNGHGSLTVRRKTGEKIMIGDSLIIIQVVEISGGYVRLNVKAPRNISVHREEIQERIIEPAPVCVLAKCDS